MADARGLRDLRTPIGDRVALALRIARDRAAVFPARRQHVLDWALDTAFRMCRAPRRSDAGAALLAMPAFWVLVGEIAAEAGAPVHWSKPVVPLVSMALECAAERQAALPAAMARCVKCVLARAPDVVAKATPQHVRELLGLLAKCGSAPGEDAVCAASRMLLAWASQGSIAPRKLVDDYGDACLAAVDAQHGLLGQEMRRALIASFVVPADTLAGAACEETLRRCGVLLESARPALAADVFAVAARGLAAQPGTEWRATVVSLFERLGADSGEPSPKRARAPQDQCALAEALRVLHDVGIAAVQSDDAWKRTLALLDAIAVRHVRSPLVLAALLAVDVAIVSPHIGAVCVLDAMGGAQWTAFWGALLEVLCRARQLQETLVLVTRTAAFDVTALGAPFTTQLLALLRPLHAHMRGAIAEALAAAAVLCDSARSVSNAATLLTATLLAASDADRDAVAQRVLPAALHLARAQLGMAAENARPAAYTLLDRAAQALVLAEERAPDAQGTLIADDMWRAIARIARKAQDASLAALIHCAGRQDHEETLRRVPMAAVLDHVPRLLRDPRIVASPGRADSSLAPWTAALDAPLPAFALASEGAVLAAFGGSYDALIAACLSGPCAAPLVSTAVAAMPPGDAPLCEDTACRALCMLADAPSAPAPANEASLLRLTDALASSTPRAANVQQRLLVRGTAPLSSAVLCAAHRLSPETFWSDAVRKELSSDIASGAAGIVRWHGVLAACATPKILAQTLDLGSHAWLEQTVAASALPDDTAAVLSLLLERLGASSALLSTWPRVAARLRLGPAAPIAGTALPAGVDASAAVAAFVRGDMDELQLRIVLQHAAQPDTAALCATYWRLPTTQHQQRTMAALHAAGDAHAALGIVLEGARTGRAVACCSEAQFAAILDIGLDDAQLCAVAQALASAASAMGAGAAAQAAQHAMRTHWPALMRVRPVLLALLVRCIELLALPNVRGVQDAPPAPSATRARDVESDARKVARAITDFARHRRADQHMHAGVLLVAAANATRTMPPAAQRVLAPALCQVVRMLDAARSAATAARPARGAQGPAPGDGAATMIGYRYASALDRVMHSLDSDDARVAFRETYALYDSEYRFVGRV